MDLETILELLALGTDVVILGLLHKSYQTAIVYANALKDADQLDIDHLKKLSQPKAQSRSFWTFWKKKPSEVTAQDRYYACVRGRVETLDKSQLLTSTDGQSSGVIHKILTKEVSAVWTGGRFWINEERIVKQVNREVPWIIRSQTPGSKSYVHVIDGLHADLLDVATIKDEFIPSPFSVSAWIGGWMAGQQVKGTQELEEMLVTGSLVTAVGEVIIGKNGTVQLRSPEKAELPYIISHLSHIDLLENYETLSAVCKWGCLIFGGIGLVLSYVLVRKWISRRGGVAQRDNETDVLNDLISSRRETDAEHDVPDWQRCVICLTRAREVIVLPCGHVCLCADCMLLINEGSSQSRQCPMCRAGIEQIARAFVP